MKHILFLALSALLVSACNTKSNADSNATASTGKDSSGIIMESAKIDNAHTANTSLDWKGLYKGMLPCADCEGIATNIMLNADNTYLIQTTYLGKGETKPIEKTGAFTWNAEGNTVLFSGIENAPNQYFVVENKLIQLDMTGKKIDGKLAEKYVLTKQ